MRGDEWRGSSWQPCTGELEIHQKGKTGKLRKKAGKGRPLWFTLNREAEEEGIGQTQRRNDKSVGEETRAQRRQNFRRSGVGDHGPELRASQKMGTCDLYEHIVGADVESVMCM